jgi:hypothetical protein
MLAMKSSRGTGEASALVMGLILGGFAPGSQGTLAGGRHARAGAERRALTAISVIGNRVGIARPRSHMRVSETLETDMTTAYYSTVLDHPLETVWSLIRDFNNYPAYIEGVSESVIEDDKDGDEVGAVRRFCYLGTWIRQRLAAHSDDAHSLTYAGIEPFPFPSGDKPEAVSPTTYQGTMHLIPITEGNRTLIEWSVALDTAPQDAERWRQLFQSWIPDWTNSLVRTLARRAD